MSELITELTTNTCPACGATGPASWSFCGSCGTSYAATAALPLVPRITTSPAESSAPETARTANPVTPATPTVTVAGPVPASGGDDATGADTDEGQAGGGGAPPAAGTDHTASVPAGPAPEPAATSVLPVRAPDRFIGARATTSRRLRSPGALTEPRRRWAIRAGAGLAVLAVVAMVVADLGVRSRLDRTNGVLATTTESLGTAQAALASTKAELADKETQLAATTTERDALRAERDAQAAELSGVKGSLDDAQSRTNLLAGQIETLKSCLNGVSSALSYFADEYYTSALAALEAVSVSCDKAGDLF